MSSISHGIIYPIDDTLYRKSTIIFNNQYIIAPAIILSNQKWMDSPNIDEEYLKKKLLLYQLIDLTGKNVSKQLLKLKTSKFEIIHKNDTLSPGVLLKSVAEICFIFNCKNISTSIETVMTSFETNSGLNVSNSSENWLPTLLTSFIILKFINVSGFEKSIIIRNLCLPRVDDTTKSQTPQINNNNTFRFRKLKKLDNISSVSSPFGNECFFETINSGIIANILGENECLLIGSMPLVWGCEGSAVYDQEFQEMVGIVINTTFTWRNKENGNLTLIARFSEIIHEFLVQSGCNDQQFIQHFSGDRLKLDKATVLIQANGQWGTGCLVKIDDHKMILTCSHILNGIEINQSIKCITINGEITSKIIHKHPKFDEPYDVAILSVPSQLLITNDDLFVNCNIKPLRIGQEIYSTGFPHFSQLAQRQFSPSILPGRITKLDNGAFFTDSSVQAGTYRVASVDSVGKQFLNFYDLITVGQSGGPIFNEAYELIGISVCNSRDGYTDVIYPNINMCIPICEIYPVLLDYWVTKDTKHLEGLIGDNEIKKVWNLDTRRFLVASKL